MRHFWICFISVRLKCAEMFIKEVDHVESFIMLVGESKELANVA